MLLASHKNVEVNIADEKAQYYISLGYKITDSKGKVIYDPIDNTDNVKTLKEQLAKKDAEIASLKKELADTKDKLKEALTKKDIEAIEKDLAKKKK